MAGSFLREHRLGSHYPLERDGVEEAEGGYGDHHRRRRQPLLVGQIDLVCPNLLNAQPRGRPAEVAGEARDDAASVGRGLDADACPLEGFDSTVVTYCATSLSVAAPRLDMLGKTIEDEEPKCRATTLEKWT